MNGFGMQVINTISVEISIDDAKMLIVVLNQQKDFLLKENETLKRKIDYLIAEKSSLEKKINLQQPVGKKKSKHETLTAPTASVLSDNSNAQIDLNSIKVKNSVKDSNVLLKRKEETKESLEEKAREYSDRLISKVKEGIKNYPNQNYFTLKLFDENNSPEKRKALYDFTTYVHYGPKCGDKENQTPDSHTTRDLSAYEKFNVERGFILAQRTAYELGYKLLDISDHLIKYENTGRISTDLIIVAAKKDFEKEEWNKPLWHGLNKLSVLIEENQSQEKPTYAAALKTDI